jgi:peptidyl-prolyl cis-trans isomerase C
MRCCRPRVMGCRVCALILYAMLLSGCEEPPPPVVATVGEREITLLDWLEECVIDPPGGDPGGARSCRAVLEEMIDRTVLALEGESRGYHDLPSIRRQLAWIEEDRLLLEISRREFGDPGGDRAAERAYCAALRGKVRIAVKPEDLREWAGEASSSSAPDEAIPAVAFEDTTWTVGDLLGRLRLLSPSGELPEDETILGELVEREIDRTLLVARARELGIDREDGFRRAMRRERDRLVGERVLEAEAGSEKRPRDAALRDYFAAHRERYVQDEEVRVNIIVVGDEEKARALSDSLSRGEDFGRLARAHSIDHSGPRGGDLGYFGRGRFLQIEDVAFGLSRGERSRPFAVDEGVAIVQLTARTPGRQLTFDEARRRVETDLREELRSERIAALLAELRRAVGVSIDEQHMELFEERIREELTEERGNDEEKR